MPVFLLNLIVQFQGVIDRFITTLVTNRYTSKSYDLLEDGAVLFSEVNMLNHQLLFRNASGMGADFDAAYIGKQIFVTSAGIVGMFNLPWSNILNMEEQENGIIDIKLKIYKRSLFFTKVDELRIRFGFTDDIPEFLDLVKKNGITVK